MKRSVIVRNSIKANQNTTLRHLLLALELARTRFAVAMAAEKRSTSLPRWQYYLDTADQMRCCLKKLRKRDENTFEMQHEWLDLLEALGCLSGSDGALRFSQTLREILAHLD